MTALSCDGRESLSLTAAAASSDMKSVCCRQRWLLLVKETSVHLPASRGLHFVKDLLTQLHRRRRRHEFIIHLSLCNVSVHVAAPRSRSAACGVILFDLDLDLDSTIIQVDTLGGHTPTPFLFCL